MQQKVDVRFRINPKTYTFLSTETLKVGDKVIVESPLGQSFGTVERVDVDYDVDNKDLKRVIRKATDKDKEKNEANCEKEHEAILLTKKLVEQLGLDMNVVNAEYSFDTSKVVIDFISDNRVDFRELVKQLASTLKTRIELRQIGTRDQARMVGGIGICGRVCCCASHLKDFEKVSMKMAKNQGLALNPTKISGACGRLMCCLEYEDPYYSETLSAMPKLNSEVKTPDGLGMVVYQNVLKQQISVKLQTKDGSTQIKDYPMDIFAKQVADKKVAQPQQSQNASKNNGNKSDQPQSAKKSTHLESSQKHKNKKPHFKTNKQQEQK